MQNLKELCQIANQLDRSGYSKYADQIDEILFKFASRAIPIDENEVERILDELLSKCTKRNGIIVNCADPVNFEFKRPNGTPAKGRIFLRANPSEEDKGNRGLWYSGINVLALFMDDLELAIKYNLAKPSESNQGISVGKSGDGLSPEEEERMNLIRKQYLRITLHHELTHALDQELADSHEHRERELAERRKLNPDNPGKVKDRSYHKIDRNVNPDKYFEMYYKDSAERIAFMQEALLFTKLKLIYEPEGILAIISENPVIDKIRDKAPKEFINRIYSSIYQYMVENGYDPKTGKKTARD